MAKALTREDLLYILQSIFRISKESENAFSVLEDGIYVKDYTSELKSHVENNSVHVTDSIRKILENISIDEDGNLLYNGNYLNIVLSDDSDNALQIIDGELYIKEIPDIVQEHIDDKIIHITEEERQDWNDSLFNAENFAKKHVKEEIDKLILYNTEIVTALPEKDISSTTLYILQNDKDAVDEIGFTFYMYIADKWCCMCITNKTLSKYALKKDYVHKDDWHNHENKDILDLLNENEDGCLTYNGKDISKMYISEEPNNAIKEIDGKAYVKDLEPAVNSLSICAAFNKHILLNEDCNEAGKYKLNDTIDNYSILLIEYYYKPEEEDKDYGCAKTAIIDTDTLNELHAKGIDYILEFGYGISNSNCKFYMNKRYLYVNYYHNICIYKITGIRKGDSDG